MLSSTTVAAAGAALALTGTIMAGSALSAGVSEANNRASSGGKDYQHARSNKEANKWAKEVGYEGAEDLKEAFVGRQGSKFNIATDRATGELILIGIKIAVEIATELFRW